MSVTHSTRIFLPMLALLAFSAACDSPARVVVEDEYPTSCDDGEGTIHTTSLTSHGRWRASEGPHRVVGAVSYENLVVEAGSLVCAAPGASLAVPNLEAIGTADTPIVFTADDPSDPWDRLVLYAGSGGSAKLHHVVISHAAGGVEANGLELRNARIENVCHTTDCAALSNTGYSQQVLADVVITGSAGEGYSSSWRTSVTFERVRIEGSQGIGLSLHAQMHLTVDGLRITGGSSYPARIGGDHIAQVAGSREAVDSLLGNGRDTLIIAAHGGIQRTTVFADLPWRVDSHWLLNAISTDTITLAPSASVKFTDPHTSWYVATLEAQGTEDRPVLISGASFQWIEPDGPAADTARFIHTLFRDVEFENPWSRNATYQPALELRDVSLSRSTIWLPEGSRMRMESAALDSSRLIVEAGSAVLTDVRMTHAWPSHRGPATDDVPHAITVRGGTLSLEMCTITGSDGDAIHVTADAPAGTTVTSCNLIDNAGLGVNDLSAYTVDAAGNWWGDAAGPTGPDGDGVAGDVIVEPVLTSPVQQ